MNFIRKIDKILCPKLYRQSKLKINLEGVKITVFLTIFMFRGRRSHKGQEKNRGHKNVLFIIKTYITTYL